MLLEGPGEWHASGSFSFSILWWDVDVGFDERWGSTPEIQVATTSGAAALMAELADPAHLEPGPPVGGSALVTLAATDDGSRVAHPLGLLGVRQKAVPLDVEIDRIGTRMLAEGPTKFSVTEVRVGGLPTDAAGRATDKFARGQYMDLSEQQKLDGQSFEDFACGVVVGTEAYVVPTAGSAVAADYERRILEPAPRLNLDWRSWPPGSPATACRAVHGSRAPWSRWGRRGDRAGRGRPSSRRQSPAQRRLSRRRSRSWTRRAWPRSPRWSGERRRRRPSPDRSPRRPARG